MDIIIFQRDGDWWDFYIGRLCISKRDSLFGGYTTPHIDETPGYWYIGWLIYRIAWKRAWTVWGDHPFKHQNIRLYDQFGTFKKKLGV